MLNDSVPVVSVSEVIYDAVEFTRADDDDDEDDDEGLSLQFASLTADPIIKLTTANVPAPPHDQLQYQQLNTDICNCDTSTHWHLLL